MAYDGEVRINTKVDTSQMQKLQLQIDKAALKVDTLAKKYDELNNKQVPTAGYVALEEKLKAAQNELSSLIAEEERLSSLGLNLGAPWDNVIEKEADARLRIEAIQEEMQKLVDTGRTFELDLDPEEIAKAGTELDLAEKELHALVTKQDELSEKTESVSGGLKRIGTTAKKSFGIFDRHVKKSHGLLHRFTSRLKSMAMSLLIFNWISRGFREMVSGMSDGFKNLAQYSDSYNKSISGLKSANTQLKNSFATAFAPIVQMAIPYLIQLINYLISAMNTMARFVALLTGKSTWTQAVKVQENYAGALNGTTAAAKKAAAALARFDDLDVLNKQEDLSGAGTGGNIKPGDMFEEVPVGELSGFLEALKDAIKEGDWYQVGALLGEKLRDALDSIPWEGIKEKAKKIATNIANFINGYIETEGLGYSIGRTLAEMLNTAILFLFTLGDTIHWKSVGLFIADHVNGFFENFDFAKLAETLNTWVDGLWELLWSAISNIDLNALLTGFWDFITNLDWGTALIIAIFTAPKLIGALLGFQTKIAGCEAAGASLAGSIPLLTTAIDGLAIALGGIAVGAAVFTIIKDPLIDLLNTMGIFNDDVAEQTKEQFRTIGGWIEAATDVTSAYCNQIDGLPLVMSGAENKANALQHALEAIDEGMIYSDAQLTKMAQNWELNAEDIEMLRQAMLDANPKLREFADDFGLFDASVDTLANITWGLGQIEAGTVSAAEAFEKFSDPMYEMNEASLEFFKQISDGSVSLEDVGLKSDTTSGKLGALEASTLGMETAMKNAGVKVETTAVELEELGAGASDSGMEIQTLTKDVEELDEVVGSLNEELQEQSIDFETLCPDSEQITEGFDGVMDNVLSSYQISWEEFKSQWLNNMSAWWDEDVTPWYAETKWYSLLENVVKAFDRAFLDANGKTKIRMAEMYQIVCGWTESIISEINSIGTAIDAIAEKLSSLNNMSVNMNVNTTSFQPSTVNIPHLATGAVIRGGNPFAAVLGDQPSGQTNIEAPLSTIEEAMENVMSRRGGYGGNVRVEIPLVMNGDEVARATIDDFLNEMKRQGYDLDVLGVD